MKKTIFTSLSPNLEADDIWLAAKLLLQPWKWREQESVTHLKHVFQEFFGTSSLVITGASGRTCLSLILEALDLAPEDEVLLQAYTCVAVPNPILWQGARPIYVDCDRETLTMSARDLRRKITPRSRVLLIQHTFGQPAPFKELLAIAKEHNLIVIEDCAHALGARVDGNFLGTFGDASFFSFGRDKVLSSVFGGIALIHNAKLQTRIAEGERCLKNASFSWILQQLLHPLLTGLAKTTYDIGIGKGLLAFGRKTRLISQPVQSQEKQGKKPSFANRQLPGALAVLAEHQLRKLGRVQQHRTELASFYHKALASTSVKLIETTSNEQPSWLRFTIQTPKAKEIIAAAKNEQIYLGDWYTTAIAPVGVDYKQICYHECSMAELAATETVNLPTDIHISIDDAKRLTDLVLRIV